MQVQTKLVIGENEFTLTETVDSHSEFFKKFTFYTSLPKVGPNGETDLVLRHRVAQGKYDYYSIVSEKAGMEFKLGQAQTNDGSLFPKGWEPLFKANGEASDDSQDQQQVVPGQSVGLGAPVTGQVTKVTTPAKPGAGGLGAATAAKPTPAPAASAPAANTPPPNTQVANQAKNVLSKFGI